MMTQDEKYMKEAIRLAKKAYAIEEVPIGCVIVYEGKIIGRGYNRRTIDKNVIAHAEMQAIRKACKKMNDWRLEDCTMYVTLEPCQMCAGAIVNHRLSRVVFGVTEPNFGACGSGVDILNNENLNTKVQVTKGVCQEECKTLLQNFFVERRKKSKN